MPLGDDASKSKLWTLVLNKIKSRLLLWQGKLLSKAGRAQLIRVVLSNLPIYFLSIFKIPNKVAKNIIQLERNFFCSGDCENIFLATIKWEIFEAPKKFGGLGFRNIKIMNLGLLLKWW